VKTPEEQIATAMLAGNPPSVLMTDAYKFSMGQAGFPLRSETFYLSFRKRGWYLVPFDLAAIVHCLRPELPTRPEEDFLAGTAYAMNAAMRTALGGELDACAAPRGSWIRETEPILTITAPSFLASVLEPMMVWLNYPIQVATAAVRDGQREFRCTCEDEATITALTLDAVGVVDATITIDATAYRTGVTGNALAALEVLDGDTDRLLEVGMRAATCIAMHRAALEAAMAAGLKQTSNVYLAQQLGLTPVGTSGHEHQQRWGDDLRAFRALRDMRSQAPGYLIDTFDTRRLGIPAALRAIEESDRACAIRFDSGDQPAQLADLVAKGVQATFIFMDGMNPETVSELESAAVALGVPAERRLYGCGGYLVADPAPTGLTRNNVAAVYKLCQSGSRPVMKFSVAGKRSLPGRPVIFRRTTRKGPVGLIGQEGEAPPDGYHDLSNANSFNPPGKLQDAIELSPATAGLIAQLSSSLDAGHAVQEARRTS